MEPQKYMKNIRTVFIILSAMLVVCSCSRRVDRHELYQEIRSSDKMIFAKMSVTKMGVIKDPSWEDAHGLRQSVKALWDKAKPGVRIAAYSYDTYLYAFINLSELSFSDLRFDDDSGTVEITLPEISVEFAGRDMELREEHYRVTGLRTEIKAEERARKKEEMNADLKREVVENETFRAILCDNARKKARKYFESLFEANGYTAIVNFKSTKS